MKTAMTLDELKTKLLALYGTDPEKEIRVRGDIAATYGPIAEVLGAISGAGFKKIGLEEPKSARRSLRMMKGSLAASLAFHGDFRRRVAGAAQSLPG